MTFVKFQHCYEINIKSFDLFRDIPVLLHPVPGAMHKQIQCEFERCAQEINTVLEFVVSLSHGALVNVNILSNLPHSQNLHCEIPEWRI